MWSHRYGYNGKIQDRDRSLQIKLIPATHQLTVDLNHLFFLDFGMWYLIPNSGYKTDKYQPQLPIIVLFYYL